MQLPPFCWSKKNKHIFFSCMERSVTTNSQSALFVNVAIHCDWFQKIFILVNNNKNWTKWSHHQTSIGNFCLSSVFSLRYVIVTNEIIYFFCGFIFPRFLEYFALLTKVFVWIYFLFFCFPKWKVIKFLYKIHRILYKKYILDFEYTLCFFKKNKK